MNNPRAALWAVIAFGVLMLAIAVGLSGASRSLTAGGFSSVHDLYGTWRTRTVAEDNLNGAYNGTIRFARGYYEVRNDLTSAPIRIDGIHYQLAGSEVLIRARDGAAAPTRIRILSHERATIQLPGSGQMLYMYRVR